ncbi:MAG: RNA-guided endonuclease InsQ/TnpB family protein [Candidatus Hodarchaeota archaeon]
MRLTYKFRYYSQSNQLRQLCHISKSLYNQANYLVIQELEQTNKWLRYLELNQQLKNSSINYQLLKAQTSQQILKVVDKNWSSFFKAIEDWKRNPEKYRGKPNPPRYKPKAGRFLLIFTNQNSKILVKKSQIILTMSKAFQVKYPDLKDPINIPIPKHHTRAINFNEYQQIRVLPRKKYFEIEVIYTVTRVNYALDDSAYLGIDLGLNNLVTMVENQNKVPVIISGKILKSINQAWNKKKAQLTSIKDKQKNKSSTGKLDGITINRNTTINDYLHKASRFIINYCLHYKIGNICLGKLKDIKDGIQLGKKTNQNFVHIPLKRLRQMLKYKADLVGIKVFEINEAYTSKCSALDLEPIHKHKQYLGKRRKRGLFQSLNGLMNADVNGALNILRKVIGDGFIKSLVNSGCLWFQPVRIRDLFQTSYKQFCSKAVPIFPQF